jgi:hypothetical protein
MSKKPESTRFRVADLRLPANRGLLLDIVVCLLNLFLMRMLLVRFLDLTKATFNGDQAAGFTVFLFCLMLFILLPIGAVLKRRPYHQRLALAGNEDYKSDEIPGGCLFNPIIFLALNLVLMCVLWAFVVQYLYGDNDNDHPGVTISLLFGGIAAVIIQTVLVYRYFSPPKKEPRFAFFNSPLSEALGDICIFGNMICYQIVWNWMMLGSRPQVSGVSDLLSRAGFLCAVALLLYFPPRVLYLAEDIHKRRTWLTILLANAPIIYRQLIGTGGWQ